MNNTKVLTTISLGLLLALTACGGNKVVTTTDDSADYQSARQLPPLTKNNGVVSAQQTIESSNSSVPGSEVKGDQFMSANIIDGADDTMRVRIDAEINAAWPYFLTKLRTSGVTIHSRNNEARRVEVGCGTMDDGSGRVEDSGWSIFNRGNIVYEYCVMALSSSRNGTLVSVYDRQGQEVRGKEAMTLLNKIVSQ